MIVTGCVAQAEGEILLKKKDIDAVVGPQSYHKFNNTLLEIENKKNQITIDFDVVEKFDNLNLILNLKIKFHHF